MPVGMKPCIDYSSSKHHDPFFARPTLHAVVISPKAGAISTSAEFLLSNVIHDYDPNMVPVELSDIQEDRRYDNDPDADTRDGEPVPQTHSAGTVSRDSYDERRKPR